MFPGLFKGFGEILAVMAVLSIVGLAAVVIGCVDGVWWLFHHVAFY